MIRVDDLAGKPIAHAVNFAAHPTSIDTEVMLYSPDYPGTLKKEVVDKMVASVSSCKGRPRHVDRSDWHG